MALYYHSNPLVMDALTFAYGAHSRCGQLRKYTNEPYIVHPMEVVSLVETVPWHTPLMLVAAALHDVVEDTDVSLLQIRHTFGPKVASLVDQLTEVAKMDDGNRTTRAAINRIHSAHASPCAKTIKLADVISNCSSIVQHDRAFAAVYLPEKLELLAVLIEGDSELWRRAYDIIIAGIALLKDEA